VWGVGNDDLGLDVCVLLFRSFRCRRFNLVALVTPDAISQRVCL